MNTVKKPSKTKAVVATGRVSERRFSDSAGKHAERPVLPYVQPPAAGRDISDTWPRSHHDPADFDIIRQKLRPGPAGTLNFCERRLRSACGEFRVVLEAHHASPADVQQVADFQYKGVFVFVEPTVGIRNLP